MYVEINYVILSVSVSLLISYKSRFFVDDRGSRLRRSSGRWVILRSDTKVSHAAELQSRSRAFIATWSEVNVCGQQSWDLLSYLITPAAKAII